MASRRKIAATYETSSSKLAPPFSSDECPNSAEDSDEDLITDYLAPPSPSATSSGTAASAAVAAVAAGWEGGLLAAAAMAHQQQQVGGPLVPIISVTPHSPGSKHYPILEENLQQLHDIHESIQQMREHSAQAFNHQMLRLNQYSRLSASCPSLNNEPGSEPDPLGSNASSPTQMHGSLCSSTHTTPQAGAPPTFRANSKELLITRNGDDPKRRRSWTALGDGTNGQEKRKSDRQRSSMSLSSMDSDQDDPFLDQSDGGPNGGVFLGTKDGSKLTGSTGNVKQRRYSGTTSPVSWTSPTTWNSGGASTHSLNDADLQSDFNKIVAKRESENLRLLPARLPLQKSVSTPSIIAVRDIVNDVIGTSIPVVVENAEPLHSTLQNLIDGHAGQRPSGTESETEEEIAIHLRRRLPAKHYPHPPSNHLSYDEFLTDSTTYDPHEGKRRKRGSLFFRKKKDKTKKVIHQWVSFSCASPQVCDWCSKILTNKPALRCETCAVTVHLNSCKDHILECNKSKISKSNLSKVTGGLGSHLQSSKQQGKRGSGSLASNQISSSSGSQMISEEKDANHYHHHGHHENFSDEVPLLHLEFLAESPITAHDLETDPFLGLQDEEPDSWSPTVGKEVTKKLKEKEIKRQEHIYEFILTEKHHCLTLRVMQKVFVEGLQKYFNMGHNLHRMFPRLADLTDIHLSFLYKLREKQKRCGPVLDSIADILLEQFSGLEAERLKSAYGEFCSRHRDAVDLYKDYKQHDHRFEEFVRHCQTNPLLKKKGIPECVLFVTQRLTKYPLLIEPLIKTAKDNKPEQEKLGRALALVKKILVEVDAQVAEKEKEDRKLEIYNKIDAKSWTTHRNQKFKKSDVLSSNRRLRFEGVATLMQGRSKMQMVLVIVLSDVLFFLLENNNKYTFFTPDNKAGVVSLQKLLVREKAGQESRGIYLISSNPLDPEMFELKVHKPKDKHSWISAVRQAVEQCPEEDEEGQGLSYEGQALSSEERRRLLEAKHNHIQHIVGVLRNKDLEQAQILEDKMVLQLQLLAAAGLTNLPEPPSYTHLVAEDTDSNTMWKEVLSVFHEVNQLASSLYASGTNLSRSVSSVGEQKSEAYVSPTLPKRAETFGGFDNANKEQKALSKKQSSSKEEHSTYSTPVGTPESEPNKISGHKLPTVPWRNALLATVPPGVLGPPSLGESSSGELPHLLTLGQEQQMAAVKLSHDVYTLLCIISQQMTTIGSLQASLSSCKQQLRQDDGGSGKDRKPAYRHNQQLEELRNLQDRLTQEKEAWTREREIEEKDIEERKAELLRLHEQVRSEQADITQQREQLYRRMEMLTSQGILISPNMPVVTAVPGQDETQEQPAVATMTTPSPPSENRRKVETKWKPPATGGPTPANVTGTTAAVGKKPLPLNLISHTNQQKSAAQNVQIKQQFPLKLAQLGGTSSGTVTGPSREGVTQMLPLKLSQIENSVGRKDRSSPQAGSYQRLSSSSFSPSTVVKDEVAGSSGGGMPTHVRTGSSPAMMQPHTSPVHQQQVTPNPNTYLRGPANDNSRSPPDTRDTRVTNQTRAPRAAEEEVIFF